MSIADEQNEEGKPEKEKPVSPLSRVEQAAVHQFLHQSIAVYWKRKAKLIAQLKDEKTSRLPRPEKRGRKRGAGQQRSSTKARAQAPTAKKSIAESYVELHPSVNVIADASEAAGAIDCSRPLPHNTIRAFRSP